MEIDGSELAIRQDKGLLSPQTQSPLAPLPDASPSPPKVTLVAADELREDQPWTPSPFHPGPSFKNLEWSADGTTVVAATTSKTILSYVLPTDLLDPRRDDDDDDTSTASTPQPRQHQYCHHNIKPQGHLSFGTTPLSFAAAPYFSLATPWTQTVLVGCPDKPLQLFPLFPGNEDGASSDTTTTPSPIATYSLIKHETEAYMAPFSLSWTAPGAHFVVGTNNLLALFDISRTSNDPPILRVPTTASLYAGALYGLGVGGNVSALAATPAHSLTAAGTWTRGVGLYDLSRAGNLASHWNLRDNRDSDDGASYDGGGVVQLLWSPCGRYLVVNERKSNGLLVYDVRGTHRLLATLTGRSNKTARPIRCTVYGSGASAAGGLDDTTFELWSGTDDGSVVMYESIGKQEGAVEPTFRWQAHDRGTSVASTSMHASGSVLATCGTSPPVGFEDSDSDSESESESESGSSSSESDENEDEDEDESNDDNDDDDDDDDDSSEDDSSGDDTSNSRSNSISSRASTARRPARHTGTTDPSLRIWSLVPLQAI